MTTHSMDAPGSATTTRILVVENDPRTRADHVRTLTQWGYQVFSAEGEGQALVDHARQLARQERCQLALVDMRLLSDDDKSDESGLELAPELKPTESLIVTGFADKPKYARLAQEKGVLAIYGKEESPAVLREAILDALAKFGDPYPEPEVLAKYKTAHSWRISIIDNNKKEREYYADLLQRLGYQVAEASHGNAIEQARAQRSHLAIVDLDSSVENIDLVQLLQPAEVVIIGTGLSAPTLRRADEMGTVASLDKKEGAEKLGEVVKSVLDRCGYRDVAIEWPEQLNDAAIAYHLFRGNSTEFVEETKDVLRRLFRNAGSLNIEDLTGPAGHTPSLTLRPHSMVLRITKDDNKLSHFTKISRKERTGDEGKNFRRIRDNFGHPSLIILREDPVTFWTLGGVVYDYVGDFINYTPIIFREFYLNHRNPREICKAIQAYRRFWGPLYTRPLVDEQGNVKYERLLIAYDRVWGGLKWRSKVLDYRNAQLQEKPQSLGTAKTIDFPAPFDLLCLPDPVAWLIEKVQLGNEDLTVGSSKTPRIKLALTHGDLHADNFFVFRTPRLEVSAIDFERAGEGPVLQDLIELEHDISTRLVSIQPGNLGEWQAFGGFVCEIVRPLGSDTFNRSGKRWPGKVDHQEADKALSVIKTIRILAREIGDSQDFAEQYAWGLLLNTIFRMMIWWEDYLEAINAVGRDPKVENLQRKDAYHAGIQRCMVLAGMLCHRLDNWNAIWPPRDWESILQEPPLSDGQGRRDKPPEHPQKPTLHLQLTDLSNPEHDFMVRVLDSSNKQPYSRGRQPYVAEELVAVMKLLERGGFTLDEFHDLQIAALHRLGVLADGFLVEDWTDRVGRHLHDALVPEDGGVRGEYASILHAQRDGGVLRLDFDKQSTTLACYPWEMQHDGYPTAPRTPIDVVRYISSDRPAQSLTVSTKPCHLLYVSARPNSLKQPKLDRDVIKDQIAGLNTPRMFQFEELEQHTHQSLKSRLINTGKPAVHILHFDGHGVFARRCPVCKENCQPHAIECKCSTSLANVHPRGYLAFEEADSGNADYVDSKKLLDGILRSQIRLVVLSSCHSARVRGTDHLLAGVGPGLILGGVPAVVAMQFSITDNDARIFFDEFYRAIIQGNSLPDAVNRGRVLLPEPARWAPVLYLRSQDDQMYLCTKA